MSLRYQSNFIGALIALAGVGAGALFTVSPAGATEKPTSTQESSATVESVDSEQPGVVGNASMSETTDTAAPSESMAARSSSTIVDLASSNDSFETLTQAIEAAGLTEVLQGEGPYTVFAPTDEAFAALPEGTLEELLKPENRETLVQILTYHVVPGEVPSSALSSGEVATVEGSPVSVTVADGKVSVNDATVVQPDIMASNGVIHVVDEVIIPPSLMPASTAPAAPEVEAAPTAPEVETEVAPQ